MGLLTSKEARRALVLAISLCHRARSGGPDDSGVTLDPGDYELIALVLIAAVEASEHGEEVARDLAGQG